VSAAVTSAPSDGDSPRGQRSRAALQELRRIPTERPLLATILCVVIAACFPIAAFHQVVFGGKSLSTALATNGVNGTQPPTGEAGHDVSNVERVDPGASAWQTEPWTELIARMNSNGERPLWNPHEAAGKPLAANAVSAPFDPLLSLVNEHATPLRWDVSFLLAFCLNSVGMFLFLFLRGLRRFPALAGAAVFAIGGYFAVFGNNPFTRGYIYLPILFLLVDRVLATRKPPWTIALGAALAAQVLVGMPEVSFFVVGVAALYALYRVFVDEAAEERLAAFAQLGIASVLGIALTAPLLLIFIRYEGLSYSTHLAGGSSATGSDPLRWLLLYAVPYYNGRPLGAYWPQGYFYSGVRGWVGAGAIASTVTCVAVPFRYLRTSAAPFFAGLAAVVAYKEYGLPGSGVVAHLPLLDRVNFAAYGPPVLQFCFAVLAAIGLDALLRGRINGRRLAVGAGVAVLGGGLLLFGNRASIRLGPSDLEFKWIGLAVAAAAVVFVAGWVVVTKPRWRAVAGSIAAVVVILEVFALFPSNSFADRAEPFRRPPWMDLVTKQQPSPKVDRVFGLDQELYPDTATALGLYDIRTVDPLTLKRWVDYLRAFVTPTYGDRFVGGPYGSAEGYPLYLDNPMFDLFGVKYLLTKEDGGTNPTSPAEFKARTGRAGSGASQFAPVGTAGGVAVYENRAAAPRAFVVHDVTAVANEQQALRQIRSNGRRLKGGGTLVDRARFDPTKQAVVEASQDDLRGVDACTDAGGDTSRITRYRPLEVRITVDAACPGLLVLSDTYYPDWTATVNGHDADVLATDVAFRGVRVPAGRSTIVFHYSSTGFDVGLWIARLAALAAIVWLGVWIVLKRRQALPARE
jgi:hypothetical protein